jgi:hypothetical protein
MNLAQTRQQRLEYAALVLQRSRLLDPQFERANTCYRAVHSFAPRFKITASPPSDQALVLVASKQCNQLWLQSG